MSATTRPDEPTRAITHRTRGAAHGPITRLMSPGDLGSVLKPFVFLDYFDDGGHRFPEFGLHPHSGIATLTYILEGAVSYRDTTGATGTIEAGGVEWMRAGRGVWHGGGGAEAPRTRGYQLWVALPPELELGDPLSEYRDAGDIPASGPARILLGAHGDGASPIESPSPMTYLAVSLQAGERWTFAPPPGHGLLWVAVARGALSGRSPVMAGELAIFEEGSTSVEFVAEEPTEFVLGSAVAHPHHLALGYYSVHTSDAALQAGEAHIGRLAEGLPENVASSDWGTWR